MKKPDTQELIKHLVGYMHFDSTGNVRFVVPMQKFVSSQKGSDEKIQKQLKKLLHKQDMEIRVGDVALQCKIKLNFEDSNCIVRITA